MVVPAVGVLRSDQPDRESTAVNLASQRAYYQDVRVSLTPLIAHVRDLPAALEELASPNGASSRILARAARTWVDDCATSRDLVRRLNVPTGTATAAVARLYETAAMVQGEAAAAAARAASVAVPARRIELAGMGQRLYELGDRMFDSAFRLLNRDGALTDSEMHFPAAVPTRGTGPVPRTEIDALADLLTAGASRAQIGDAQRGVEAPTGDVVAQEAVTALRLAALVAAEGSDRLRSIGARLWNGAAKLLTASSTMMVRHLVLDLPEDTLFRGGAFDGRPPALSPGDPVDKGVPGGLPVLDSTSLLSQRAAGQ